MYIQQTIDGGYIVTGLNSSSVYLIKTDENGDSLWSKTFYNESGFSVGNFVQQQEDQGYIITGHTSIYIEEGVFDNYV